MEREAGWPGLAYDLLPLGSRVYPFSEGGRIKYHQQDGELGLELRAGKMSKESPTAIPGNSHNIDLSPFCSPLLPRCLEQGLAHIKPLEKYFRCHLPSMEHLLHIRHFQLSALPASPDSIPTKGSLGMIPILQEDKLKPREGSTACRWEREGPRLQLGPSPWPWPLATCLFHGDSQGSTERSPWRSAS